MLAEAASGLNRPLGLGEEKREKYEEEKQSEGEKYGLVLQAEAASRLFEQLERLATESWEGLEIEEYRC